GTASQPVRAAPPRFRPGLSLHLARSRRGPPSLRSNRGDVPREAGRDRPLGFGLPPAPPSLHRRAARRRAGRRPRPEGTAASAREARRRAAFAAGAAERLPVPHALPARRSALRERGAAPAGRRIGSRCRLPLSSRRGRAGDDGGQARSAGADRLMISFVLRRVVQLVPVLLGVTLLAFLLVNLLPGNMALAILGPDASQEAIAHLQQQLGLNQ